MLVGWDEIYLQNKNFVRLLDKHLVKYKTNWKKTRMK